MATTKSQGTVTLTVEAYNELLLQLTRVKEAIKVKERWGEEIQVVVDTEAIKDIIVEKFKASEFAETHTLKASKDWYEVSGTIGHKNEGISE